MYGPVGTLYGPGLDGLHASAGQQFGINRAAIQPTIVSANHRCAPTEDIRTITALVIQGSWRVKTAGHNSEFNQVVTTRDIFPSAPSVTKELEEQREIYLLYLWIYSTKHWSTDGQSEKLKGWLKPK